MHKEIISSEQPIYDCVKAKLLYSDGVMAARKLSNMKQDNIKKALSKRKECGLCFEFRENTDECDDCPIYKRTNHACWESNNYGDMLVAGTKALFGKAHKKWCREIGLNVYKGKC